MERSLADKRKDADSEMKKEIEQLRNSLDEKTQQIFAAEDTIYRQKEVVSFLNLFFICREHAFCSLLKMFLKLTNIIKYLRLNIKFSHTLCHEEVGARKLRYLILRN